MKKLLALITAVVMCLSLVACGYSSGTDTGSTSAAADSGSDTTNTDGGSSSSSGTSIRLVNGKIEIDSQLKDIAAQYEEETGVHVEIESLGGGIDIQGTLKGYYQAGNMPDIFVNNGTDFINWEGMLVDMSDQDWVDRTDSEYVDDSGAVIGFPYTVEAIGMTYNADILEQAGIDPDTLTSPDAYRTAFETLDGMKDELGITSVVGYYTEPVNLYWTTGNHMFANYLDAGLARDDTTYSDLLADGGQLDTERFTHFAEFIDLIQQYSDPTQMISGTYDQQILNFASGEYAFVTQGSWIGATMTGDDADAYASAGNFAVGMAPCAFEDGIDTILTCPPSYWSVYADSPNVDAALAFLQWLTEDEGQQGLVMEANMVSPFTDCTYAPEDPFAQIIMDYQNAGKTSNWHWSFDKEGLAQNATGQVFSDFAQGTLDVDGFVSTMQQVIAAYYAE